MQDTETIDDTNDCYERVDVLASDFLARYRDGNRPTVEEYVRRHPELSVLIRKMFPLVLSVEKVKFDRQVARDGSATLAGKQVEQLGDFRLIAEIGRGGMGIVYEAEQQSLGRSVAIKLLPKQSLLDNDSLARFRREAKTAAAMHHSNIVPIFGTGETDGMHYLVMQLVRGEGLDSRIANSETRFSVNDSARIAMQVAGALAYAHASGVLHRDIKPANILIDENETAQITDFGLARNAQDDPTVTRTLSGSLRYMAPERFRGVSDEQGDVYAVGLTLYEMLAKKPAFAETDPHHLMDAIRHHRVTPLKTIRVDVPKDLDTIVSRAIASEPSLRYRTAADLHHDLERFLAGEPVQARPLSSMERCVRWCRRNPKVASAVGVAAASLVIATCASTAGWLFTSAANQRTTAALNQSNATVDLALQSLEGVVDMVAVPPTTTSVGLDEIDDPTLRLDPSPHTAKVLERIQPLYERLSQQSPTRPDIIVQMTRASIRLAMIQRQLGQSSAAIESLSRGIQILNDRSQQAGLPIDQQQILLAALHNELGDLYAAEMRFDESDAAYEDAIVAAQTLGATDNEAQLQLARAHVALGDPPPQRRRMEGPADRQGQTQRDHLSNARRLLEGLHESIARSSDVETLRARVQLAESRTEIGPARKQAGFQKAVDILRDQLAVVPDDAVVRFTLVETLASVNLRREIRTRFQRLNATSRLEASLQEIQPLRSRFPDTPVFAVAEVHIRHKLSSIARSHGEIAKASDQLQQAIVIQSALVDASPQDFSHRCWRALLYRSQAEICQRKGDDRCAQDAITNAVNDLAAIGSSDNEHPFVKQTRQIILELESRSRSNDDQFPS